MNQVTLQIATLLNVNLEIALKIQNYMECDDFDFSECTNKQFTNEVKKVFSIIL